MYGIPRGSSRINQKEPRFTDWTRDNRAHSSELSRKFYPTLDAFPHGNGYVDHKTKKKSLPSSTQSSEKQAKVLCDVFSRFADTTSLHTMPFINRASRWYAKLIWVLIFLAASGVWIFHSYYLIKTYLSYETTSSVKIVYETIDFPSVSLCNINPARTDTFGQYASQEFNDFLEEITPNAKYYVGDEVTVSNNTTTGGAGNGVTSPNLPTTPPAQGRKKRDAAQDGLPIEAYEYTDYVDMTGFEAAQGVNWTKYLDLVNDFDHLLADDNVREYVKVKTVFEDLLAATPENFSRWLDINYGTCWTFNSFQLSSGAMKSARGGSGYGLELIMYIQDKHYIQGLNLGRGLRLEIHPFGSMPFVKQNGISASPGLEYYFSTRMVNQTRLGGSYGACDNKEFVEYYGNTYNYTIEACINTCLDRTIAETCNCYRRTQRQYYRESDLVKGYCNTDTELACSAEQTSKFSTGELWCDCNQACETIEYDTMNSFDVWPEDAKWFSLVDAVCLRNAADCQDLKSITEEEDRLAALRNNFLHLNIFYKDLNVEKIEEKPAYEFVQFGSDLGGAIGLWIGASLITLFEFLELSCQLCNFCGRRSKYKERKQQIEGSHHPQEKHYPPLKNWNFVDRSRSFGDKVSGSQPYSTHWNRHSRVEELVGIV